MTAAGRLTTALRAEYGIVTRWPLAQAICVALAGLAVACGGNSSETAAPQPSCASLGHLTCPSPPPSYKADVQPIIEKHCYGCHGPGGVKVSSIDLASYAEVVKLRGDILVQTTSCPPKMPRPDAGPLTIDELTTFAEWLGECSAPNN